MKILVTSGGTMEYIDDVRVMTNISSGRLGALIAEKFAEDHGAEVHYLHGKNSYMPGIIPTGLPCKFYKVTTAQDAYDQMEVLVPAMDAVVHCMAVSDFTFKRDIALKCKSNDPQAFIDFMGRSITPNPKIISKIKEWNPKTILVGFKFEVDIPHKELIQLAHISIQKNSCYMVIANDKAEMVREKSHIAYAVTPVDSAVTALKLTGKEQIAEFLCKYVVDAFSVERFLSA